MIGFCGAGSFFVAAGGSFASGIAASFTMGARLPDLSSFFDPPLGLFRAVSSRRLSMTLGLRFTPPGAI